MCIRDSGRAGRLRRHRRIPCRRRQPQGELRTWHMSHFISLPLKTGRQVFWYWSIGQRCTRSFEDGAIENTVRLSRQGRIPINSRWGSLQVDTVLLIFGVLVSRRKMVFFFLALPFKTVCSNGVFCKHVAFPKTFLFYWYISMSWYWTFLAVQHATPLTRHEFLTFG